MPATETAKISLHDHAFYDREYNARAAIADANEVIAQWRSKAQLARAELPGLKDLKYGESSEASLDLFWCLQPDRPLLVFIHGGYWRALHKDDFSWIARPYVSRGINVAVLNYDLIPKISLRALVQQVIGAVAWLYDHGEPLDFDPHQLFVSGHSAGGHLSAMMAAVQWSALRADLPDHLIKGAVALSGLFDLEPLAKAPFITTDLNLSVADVHALSPVNIPPQRGLKVHLTVGEHESSEFHRQNQVLLKAWGTQVSMTHEVALGRNHLTVCDAFAEPGHPLFETTLAMMG
jgi:arylformamidase